MLASMDRLARRTMPPQATVIDIPASGPGAAFDMPEREALDHMTKAAAAVRGHFQ